MSLTIDLFLDFEQLKTHLTDITTPDGTRPGFYDSPIRVTRKIDTLLATLTNDELADLIHAFVGKWPTRFPNAPTAKTDPERELFLQACGRFIQTKYFAIIHGKQPTDTILARDEQFKQKLFLCDDKITSEKPKAAAAAAELKKPQSKPKKAKLEVSAKLAEMTLEQLTTYAQELGATQKTFDKHKDKPEKMRKIYIANFCRSKLMAAVTKVTAPTEPKVDKRQPKLEISQKLSEMSMEDLITYAKTLGATEEFIKKHLARPENLARNYIASFCRSKIMAQSTQPV